MAKIQIKANPRVTAIFNDLEKYLDFCKEYGYKFDEAELYSNKSNAYRQYTKMVSGKQARNNWVEDAKVDA
jgi:hypothetical protein